LIIGSGGREHTLVWKLAQSAKVKKLYCAPGNGGIASLAECVPIDPLNVDELVAFVKRNQIDLTVVGPEAPLMAGIVDRFEQEGIPIFGPKREAALIEGSKSYAKALMSKYGIPTAKYATFTSAEKAKEYVICQGAPIVIKADGLAAGKGVVVAFSIEEAIQAVEDAMENKVFGEAGGKLVIEEYLEGQEISLMAFMDESGFHPMVPAQDHKRIFDGDQGPNTGGMGAYSPVPQISQEEIMQAIDTIIKPMYHAFQSEGICYRGVLYAGLMMTKDGPKVIEFNARFGDPETQVVLPRLKSDLFEILWAVSQGKAATVTPQWDDRAAVCVVMASRGYPGEYEKGKKIEIPPYEPDQILFHAGTAKMGDELKTNGGRVLGVTGLGQTVAEARERAYELVKRISFAGAHYRTDIASRALEKK
jgi:phosphoribosylamine--glycine ligase